MGLDNKAIETLAVNAVKNSIVTSELLDQFINDNDKEPSWDGFIYIYGDKSKQKSTLKGRMPVQVKGKEYNNHFKEIISFSMSTVDLKNYLNDGGCILFVVYIGNNGLTNKIYYEELTPIKLRLLLDEAKEQDSKTIRLKEFPSDNNEKTTIFLNCLMNCQRQASFKDGKLLTLDELQKQGALENIFIPVSVVGETDLQMALIKNEVYLYTEIKGSSIPHPIDMVIKNVHTEEVIDNFVSIEDRVFYTNYKVIKSINEVTIFFGESFTIKFSEKNKFCKINYNSSNKMRILAKDLDFMLTCLDKGYFKVNDIKFPIDSEAIDYTNFNIAKETERLSFIKDVVKVLDMLGCSEDIDINDMVGKDWRNLNYLVKAFLYKELIKGLKDDLSPIISLEVAKLRFIIYIKKCEEKGTYEIYDFFKTDFLVLFEDENNNGKNLPISQFIIFHENDFLTLSNMNFDVLLPSFQNVEKHYETFNIANSFLLELLNAYDKAKSLRKEKILKTCKDFSNWIAQAPEDELDYNIKTLNILQTIKRWRNFNNDEIRTLYAMVENNDTPEDCIVGAYLLLDQQQAAEIHFSKLTMKEQENFKKYPIYRYWKIDHNKNIEMQNIDN
ncbi:hypothetical protein [[Clostridium] colinum]|uniref:hypothetical protein n=1 Tax=[Clostridium] colinum TaxID=36835 RepID=UPI002024836E|nr:hypothetical protein [[Clostridium] colinum]